MCHAGAPRRRRAPAPPLRALTVPRGGNDDENDEPYDDVDDEPDDDDDDEPEPLKRRKDGRGAPSRPRNAAAPAPRRTPSRRP